MPGATAASGVRLLSLCAAGWAAGAGAAAAVCCAGRRTVRSLEEELAGQGGGIPGHLILAGRGHDIDADLAEQLLQRHRSFSIAFARAAE